MNWNRTLPQLILILSLLGVFVLPVQGSIISLEDQQEQIRAYSRKFEFDPVSWTVSALGKKLAQNALPLHRYLSPADQRNLVLDYLDLWRQITIQEGQLASRLADPSITGQDPESARIREELDTLQARRENIILTVEQVLENQLNRALVELDIGLAGQLVPPVLYRSEPNSYALIVSPREEIRQEANLMLVRGLSLDQIVALENAIEEDLKLSALVVGIGGVGLYPSMIIESANLDWLIDVISHEWTHNYLTLRPLGMNYNASPELRTINESVADLSADDVQRTAFQLYYPEYLPDDPPPEPAGEEPSTQESDAEPQDEPGFDFRAEMHLTRLEVDRLLEEGKIEEAEAYMESRRVVFWENGYQIRKLNQAYFAFHGSYAADPGGAAGEEGVDLGSQLRSLKASQPSYREFMRLVAWRWRLDQFEELFASLN